MTFQVPPDFWHPDQTEGSLGPIILPPFDREILLKCQQRLGVMLPEALVSLLRTKNGGSPRYSELECEQPTLWGEMEVRLHTIAGICSDRIWLYGLDNYEIDFVSFGDEDGAHLQEIKNKVGESRLLVPLCRDAHSMIALDYRNCPYSDNPPITWMTFDEDCDSAEIVSDFETLLTRLKKPM